MKKTMGFHSNSPDNVYGFAVGSSVGVVQYFLNIHLPTDFWSKLFEAGLTAGICGFIGMLGKELFIVARRAFIAYFRHRKKRPK
jgi:hypothetical protein